jgi:hypothetical protein
MQENTGNIKETGNQASQKLFLKNDTHKTHILVYKRMGHLVGTQSVALISLLSFEMQVYNIVLLKVNDFTTLSHNRAYIFLAERQYFFYKKKNL